MSKETVITFVDGDSHAHVWTNIKRDITAISKKLPAEKAGTNNDGNFAEFLVPVDLFRPAGIVGGKRNFTEEQRAAAAQRMRDWHNSK